MQLNYKPKLYIPANIFGDTIEMKPVYQGYPVVVDDNECLHGNLGADATAPSFYENHKNLIIVGAGCLILAGISALFIHHAGKMHRESLANKSVKKNGVFIPEHIKQYAKTTAKMAPDHFRYYKGVLGI